MLYPYRTPKTGSASIEADCVRLARSAERWGAGGQAETLARLADFLSAADFYGAARLRDELLETRNWARREVISSITATMSKFARSIGHFLAWGLPEAAFAAFVFWAVTHWK